MAFANLLQMLHVCDIFQTLASHSSILKVAISTVDRRASRAVDKVSLTTSAGNIVQVDCASASTKMSIAEGYCICFHSQ